MSENGPELALMIHHLGGCPQAFHREPCMGKTGVVDTQALCRDTIRLICLDPLSAEGEAAVPLAANDKNHLLTVQIGCWFFSHPWFLGKESLIVDIIRFFSEGLSDISAHVTAGLWVQDMERKEEFCRLALLACGLAPLGETEDQALERFESVSTLKRKRILSRTAASYERMQRIRRQMAERAAREAANVYGRE